MIIKRDRGSKRRDKKYSIYLKSHKMIDSKNERLKNQNKVMFLKKREESYTVWT